MSSGSTTVRCFYVENSGVRFGPPEVMARMARGEAVDPAQVYFPQHAALRDRRTGLSMVDAGFVHRIRRALSEPGRPVGVRGRLARRADRVGHHRAPLAKRLFGAHRRIPRGLMLDLGVKLAAKQDDDG